MFRHNPKANYQPNGGRYLQILSGKDLYKQTIVVSARTHDNFPARFLNIFVNHPLGQMTSCHTCNIFVNNQSFKSNLTGKEYKTISYDRLSCGSTNVIYGIHCVHCGLVYVGETGRSLRSRMNGHRSAIKKEDKAYSTDTFINQIILWMT